MARLMRYDPKIKGEKYLVQRRDGTFVEWPHFTLGAGDPAAIAALIAYAKAAEASGMDPAYIADIQELVREFEAWRREHGPGDPDATYERHDDPVTVGRMLETWCDPAWRTARGGGPIDEEYRQPTAEELDEESDRERAHDEAEREAIAEDEAASEAAARDAEEASS